VTALWHARDSDEDDTASLLLAYGAYEDPEDKQKLKGKSEDGEQRSFRHHLMMTKAALSLIATLCLYFA
jgi:hypothetical protein